MYGKDVKECKDVAVIVHLIRRQAPFCNLAKNAIALPAAAPDDAIALFLSHWNPGANPENRITSIVFALTLSKLSIRSCASSAFLRALKVIVLYLLSLFVPSVSKVPTQA